MGITLTDAAVEKVKGLMEAQNRAGAGLRVFVQGGGCAGFKYGMAFDDTVEDSDQVYDFSGLRVIVDEMSGPYVDGASIDYQDTLEGAGFAITNPNVESSCGCGSSFKRKDDPGHDEHEHAHAHAHSHSGGCSCCD